MLGLATESLTAIALDGMGNWLIMIQTRRTTMLTQLTEPAVSRSQNSQDCMQFNEDPNRGHAI